VYSVNFQHIRKKKCQKYICTTLGFCQPARQLSCNRFRAPASVRLSHTKYIFAQLYGSAYLCRVYFQYIRKNNCQKYICTTLGVGQPACQLLCNRFRAPASVRLSHTKCIFAQLYESAYLLARYHATVSERQQASD
jgi:hypothetical protein